MKLPYGMYPSSIEERKQFYTHFEIKKARNWIGRKVVYAIIIGRHSAIYLPEYKKDKDEPLIIDNYHTLNDVLHYILKFLPEGVYYDRNYYKDFSLCQTHDLRNAWKWENFAGQELAFDLDPENVDCPIHGTYQERLNKGWGLSFCKTVFKITCDNTVKLYDKLVENYTDVRIIFSGRGFHIHVFDKDANMLTRKQREEIAYQYRAYGIDAWVTSGEMRLIRLPYSLNGISSRIVLPLDASQVTVFNPKR